MTMRIYTKTGDAGETGLWGGQRVSKDDVRVEAIGALDEFNAAMGWVRTEVSHPDIDALCGSIQHTLFALGSVLASPTRLPPGIALGPNDVTHLEEQIDLHEATLPALQNFILPGGTPAAAALHCARGACRRAERRCISLERHSGTSHGVPCVPLLNRLSDLLFVLARVVNNRAQVADVPWRKKGSGQA